MSNMLLTTHEAHKIEDAIKARKPFECAEFHSEQTESTYVVWVGRSRPVASWSSRHGVWFSVEDDQRVQMMVRLARKAWTGEPDVNDIQAVKPMFTEDC